MMKSAKVIPLIEKPNHLRNDLNNSQPASNLSFISKLIEITVAVYLNGFVHDNELDELLQPAYRPLHRTKTALLCVKSDKLCTL